MDNICIPPLLDISPLARSSCILRVTDLFFPYVLMSADITPTCSQTALSYLVRDNTIFIRCFKFFRIFSYWTRKSTCISDGYRQRETNFVRWKCLLLNRKKTVQPNCCFALTLVTSYFSRKMRKIDIIGEYHILIAQ